MPRTSDVLILGAGIVGAACALELATAGLRVDILEADVVGSGATAAGMGHVVVMDDSPAQLALTHYSQQLWDDLVQNAPHDYEYDRCGTLWIADGAEEFTEAQRKHTLLRDAGVACEVVDERGLYQLEPELRRGLAGALLVTSDSIIYPPRAAALLLERAVSRGTRLLKGRAVSLEAGGVRLHDGTTLSADAIVVATGAHAVDLMPELPIRPKKGHLAITDRYPGFVHHELVELGYIKNAHAASGDSVAFNVQPRPTGQLLIGSSRQFDAPDPAVDYRMLARMLTRAATYLPRLDGVSCLRVWTGYRAATPDGLPLIGPCPDRPGVWLATGHEGLGITTAPATAALLAAQMVGNTCPLPIEPYLPSRTWEVSHA